MKDKKEKILNIRNKIENYNKFLLEYGYNREKDIFIDDDLSKLLEELDELEKEINDEK
jgi:hypothetical protein